MPATLFIAQSGLLVKQKKTIESQENVAIAVPTSCYQAGKNVDLANVLQKGQLKTRKPETALIDVIERSDLLLVSGNSQPVRYQR